MLKFFTSAISRALGFSKVEARGTLMLIFIMLAAIVGSQLYIKNLKSQVPVGDPSELSEWVQTVEASISLKIEKEEKFDKSVYLPTPNQFKRSTKETKPIYSKKEEKPAEKPIVIEDLNHATVDDLQRVRGIGSSFSERIVKYREKLGDFASSDQLNEVYGLSPETVNELQKHFSIQSPVQQFNINSDSAKVLASHPYISYDLAWIIINYRKQNGDISSLEDLKKIKAVDEETFTRLKPYLD